MTRVAVMQPYFLPHLGYWTLMSKVDTFVIYRDIEFSKSGWVNRNKLLLEGQVEWFTVPLEKASDYAAISERRISATWPAQRDSLLNKIEKNYQRAEFFDEVHPWIRNVFLHDTFSLMEFLRFSIFETHALLGLDTHILEENAIGEFSMLRGQNRVLAVCKALEARQYLNPPGGVALYSKSAFAGEGIELEFLNPVPSIYSLHEGSYPNLSIFHTLAHHGVQETRRLISKHT